MTGMLSLQHLTLDMSRRQQLSKGCLSLTSDRMMTTFADTVPWCTQELGRLVQSRQAEGFRVVKYSGGVAHDNVDMHLSRANLHYLVLLQRQNL